VFRAEKLVSEHFQKFGRFFLSLWFVGRMEQGAGELGPLGSAGRTIALPQDKTI